MSGFITAITEGTGTLSATTLWANVVDIAPLVVILVLFSLGRRVINKNLKAAGKGTTGRI